MNTSPEKALLPFLRRQRKLQTEFLAELVKTPSDNPPGDCRAHGERSRQLLEALQFEVKAYPVSAAAAKAVGMIGATNLIARERFVGTRGRIAGTRERVGETRGRLGAGRGPTIALNAHGDVVPPGLGWSVNPYGAVIKNGTMYGRGVAVSKSDFATYAFAVLALKAASAQGTLDLRGQVELHLTYDEESGGDIGPRWLLERGLTKPDYVISAGFAHGITIAHNGCLHLEVEVVGRSGHAARPATGIDALEAANGLMNGLYALRKTWRNRRSRVAGIDSPTLVIGLIEGGINTNVVPDKVTFRIDRRIIPEENPVQAERELLAAIRGLAKKWPGIRVNTRRILLARPFTPVRGQDTLVTALRRHAKSILREDIKPHGVPLYTDARHYSAAGIPTVLYGAGPRTLEEANGHRADEKLKLADLYAATEVVALTLAELLGAKP